MSGRWGCYHRTDILQTRADYKVPTPDAFIWSPSLSSPQVPRLSHAFLGFSLGSPLGQTIPSLCDPDSPVIVSTSRIYLENKIHTCKVQGVKPGLWVLPFAFIVASAVAL